MDQMVCWDVDMGITLGDNHCRGVKPAAVDGQGAPDGASDHDRHQRRRCRDCDQGDGLYHHVREPGIEIV